MSNGFKVLLGLGIAFGVGLAIYWMAKGNNKAIQQSQTLIRGITPGSYTNEETTEITWNDDGFPVKIVRHRKALRT